MEKDPNRRVQQAVSLVFAKFLELNSARQVMLWLLKHDLELPVGMIGHGGEAAFFSQQLPFTDV